MRVFLSFRSRDADTELLGVFSTFEAALAQNAQDTHMWLVHWIEEHAVLSAPGEASFVKQASFIKRHEPFQAGKR